MALRDIQLIPGLEGSTHINLDMAAQFLERYLARGRENVLAGVHATTRLGSSKSEVASPPAAPESLALGNAARGENEYLLEARSGAINSITFPHYLDAYRPLGDVANVRIFARQVARLRRFIFVVREAQRAAENATVTQAIGQCLAMTVYAQLVAENARIMKVPGEMVSAIFELLIGDLNACALKLASLPEVGARTVRGLIALPRATSAEWDFVAERNSPGHAQG